MKINHISHPFKFTDDKNQIRSIAKKNQKTTILATLIAGIFSLGIAALPVFYGLSAYYRSQAKRKYTKSHLTKKTPKETVKTDDVFKKTGKSSIPKKDPIEPKPAPIPPEIKADEQIPNPPAPISIPPTPLTAKVLDTVGLNNISDIPKGSLKDIPIKTVVGVSETEELKHTKKRTRLEDIPQDLAKYLSDEKIFNFIHGDVYRSKHHEGGDSVQNLKALAKYISIGSPLKNSENVLKMISNCLSLEEKHNLQGPKESRLYDQHVAAVQNYSSELHKQILGMEPTERILMTGGWMNSSGGHAMLYLVEKQKNGNYAFTVINTGAGLNDFHESKRIDLKTKYRPIHRLKDIKPERLNRDFLVELKKLEIPYKKNFANDVSPSEHKASDIYSTILSKLKGKRDSAYENKVEFITSQRMGSCSWKSAMKLLFLESENTPEYKYFTFDLRSSSIAFRLQRLQNNPDEIKDASIEMLNSAVNNFSRFSTKLHKQKIIFDYELDEAFSLITQAKTLIDKWRKEHEVKPVKLAVSEIPVFKELKIPETIFSPFTPSTKDITPFENAHLHLLNKGEFTFPNSLTQLTSDLEQLINAVQQQAKVQDYQTVSKQITGMFLSLEKLGLGKNEYWETLCQGQKPELIEKIMGQFELLSRLYFSAISYLPKQERRTPDQIAIVCYLMAINLKLAEHLDSDHNPLQNNLVVGIKEVLEAFEYNFNAIINHGNIRRLYPQAKRFFEDLPEKSTPEESDDTPEDVFAFADYARRQNFGGDVVLTFDHENKLNRGSYSTLNSSTVAGLKKLLANPNFIENSIKLWPHLKGANHKQILVEVFKNWGQEDSPVPKSYRFLMQQKLSLDYLLSEAENRCSDERFEFKLVNGESAEQITDTFVMSLVMDDNVTLGKPENAKKDLFKINQSQLRHLGFKRLFENANKVPPRNIGPKWYEGIDWNCKGNAAAGANVGGGLKRRDGQEIGVAICSHKLRVSNVVAYLKNNPEKLLERKSQLFFYQTLLSAPNLETMLGEDNGELRLKIASFIREQYELQKTMGNTQVQLYYLWIAERIGEIAPKFIDDLSIDVPAELIGVANGINDYSFEGKNTKALIYHQLMACYYRHKILTDDQTLQLAKAYAYAKAYGFNKELSHLTINERVYLTKDRLFFELGERDKHFQQHLAEEISAEIFGKRNSAWVNESSNFIDKNHDVTINFYSLSIRENGMELGELPREILVHPDFTQIFKDNPFQAKSPKPGFYEITLEGANNTKDVYQLFFTDDNQLKIQKMIQGELCTFISKTTLDKSLGAVSGRNDLIIGYLHWAASGKRIFVEDEQKRQLTSIIELAPNHQVARWIKVSPGKPEDQTERKDVFSYHPSAAHLTNFAPRPDVHVWGNKLIDFTKLGIQFNLDKGFYRFSEDTQFYLAKTQNPPPGLNHLSGFLRLQSEQKGVKYLFPSGAFNFLASRGGPYGRTICIEPSKNKPKYFKFELKNGQLIGKTSEERIFLAYLHLGHKNYDEAAALLKQFQSGKPRGYSQDEMHALNRIISRGTGDNSPSSLAVCLQAVYLLVSSLPLDTSDKDKHQLQKVYAALLDEYYPVSQHTKLRALTPSQELEILDFIIMNYHKGESLESFKAPSDLIVERHKQLKAAGAKYAAKHDAVRKMKHVPVFTAKGIIPLELTTVEQLLKQFQLTPGDPSSLPYRPSAAMSEPELEKHIQGLAPPENASKVEQAEYRRVQASIRADHANKVKKNNFHLSQEQLESVSSQLDEQMIPDLENAANRDLQRIIVLANTLPENPLDALRFQLNIIGEKKKKLTIDDLLVFYLQKNSAGILRQNPSLTEAQLSELYALITQYLVKTTQCTYLRGLKKACDDAFKSTGTQKEKDLDDLCDRLLQNRMYHPQSNPLALVFEHTSGFRLKESQVSTIHKLVHGNSKGEQNIIDQLIMNSGKTKVLSPLLAYFLSDGKNIPIMVVPDQLYENTLEDSRRISGDNLQQEVETIVLKKDTRLDIEGIDALIKKMEKVKGNRSYFLVNSTTMHNLRLNFIEVCNELADLPLGSIPGPMLEERYTKMKELRNLIEAEGILLIDEVDLVLECTKEVNSASGRWDAVSRESADCLTKVFDAIIARPALREFLKIDKESEIPFDPVKFQDEIQPQLVTMFIELAGFADLEREQKNALELYLRSSVDQDKRPDFIAQASPEARRLLALGKEMIKVKGLLTSTIDQKCNENFGLSREFPINMAIPYAQKDQPSEGSEFSSPYETMIYTMLYYTRQGVTANQLEKIIERLRGEVLNELKSDGTPLQETRGYKKFAELNLMPGRDLFSIQTGELKEAVKTFNAKIENRMRFAKVFGWSEIGTFSERLPSNPQHLVGMPKRVIGFSGTTSNQDTFHKKLVVEHDPAADGLTLNLLYRSNPTVTAFSDDKVEFLKSLGNYQACIDAGSWFRGCDARKTAQQILAHLPDNMKGVIYINDIDVPVGTKGQQVILERKADLPRLLSQTNYPKDERFTYYNVTTGVDIPQDDLARALVTISRNLPLDRLLQAVWRMRGLDRKQKVDFALPEELEGVLGEASFEKIEQLVIQNQTANQKKNNLPATKQKISYEMENLVDKVLRSPKLTVTKAAAISREVKDIIAKKTLDDLEVLFGNADHAVEIDKVIKDHLDNALELIKPAYEKFPEFTQVIPINQLEADMNAVVNYDLLPLTEFKGGNQEGQTLQVNKNVNVDQKSQNKLELKLELITDYNDYESDVRDPNRWVKHNYYTRKFWGDSGAGVRSINGYVQDFSKNLIDVGVEPNFFSRRLAYTRNFVVLSNWHLENPLVPFQSRSLPIGISVLRRDLKGNLDLVALYPAEAEKMWQVLDDERDFDKKVLAARWEQIKPVSGSIALEELDILFQDEGGFIQAQSTKGLRYMEHEMKFLFSRSDVNFEAFTSAMKKIRWDLDWIDEFNANLKKDGIHLNETQIKKIIDIHTKHKSEYFFTREQLQSFAMGLGAEGLINKLRSSPYYCIKTEKKELLLSRINRRLKDIGLSENWKPHLRYDEAIERFGGEKQMELFLVDPALGIIKTGRKKWSKADNDALENDPKYIQLVVQAKYFNGVLNNYSKLERAALTEWFKKDPDKMEKFFLVNVLAAKPIEQQNYPESVIQRSFAAAR